MLDIGARLIEIVGQNWVYALAAAFVAMVFDSSAPKLPEGEEKPPLNPIRFLAMVAGFVTPALLLMHAYGAMVFPITAAAALSSVQDIQRGVQPIVLIAVVVVLGAAVLISGLIGLIIGRAIPPLGRALYMISPLAQFGALGFTICVTWRVAGFLFDSYMLGGSIQVN